MVMVFKYMSKMFCASVLLFKKKDEQTLRAFSEKEIIELIEDGHISVMCEFCKST